MLGVEYCEIGCALTVAAFFTAVCADTQLKVGDVCQWVEWVDMKNTHKSLNLL